MALQGQALTQFSALTLWTPGVGISTAPASSGGTPYHVPDVAGDRQEIALAAVRRFVEQHGCLPTQDSWPVARMTPYERTVHKMFGSFRAAVEAAGALDLISGRPD